MKIHWFSPLPPEQTDIGNYTLHVCRALAEKCELSIWTHPRHFGWRGLRNRIPNVRFLPYTAVNEYRESLNRADCIFYNLGNNAAFHREIVSIMRDFTGVAITHDLSLFECISSIYRERFHGEQLFLDLTRHHYGPDGEALAMSWLGASDEKRKAIDIASPCPFISHGTLGAWGIVSHTVIQENSEIYSDPRPRWALDLPYPSCDRIPEKRGPRDRLDLLIYGYIGGPNRRLEEVLKAIQTYPNKERLRLHIAGIVNPSMEIESRIRALGLEKLVTIYGFVPDKKLDKLIRSTSLVLNLRYPTRGEASGSLLRAWSQGAPVVVSNAGFYADLPDETVWKIDPHEELVELHELWNRLLNNPEELNQKAEAGYVHLNATHSIAAYVEALLKIAQTPDSERTLGIKSLLEQRLGLMASNTLKVPEGVEEFYLRRMQIELEMWFA